MIEAVVGRADRRRVIALFWSQIDADLYWDAMVTAGRFRVEEFLAGVVA